MTSKAGTEMADFIFHTLGIGAVSIVLGLVAPTVAILLLGKFTGGSFSVTDIKSRRGEVPYWALILTSNTIGTGIGDGLGVTVLGKLGGTVLIAAIILGVQEHQHLPCCTVLGDIRAHATARRGWARARPRHGVTRAHRLHGDPRAQAEATAGRG